MTSPTPSQEKVITAGRQSKFATFRAKHLAFFVFAICMLSSTLTNMDQSLFSYVLPDIMGSFAFSLNDTGSIISLSFVAAIIIAPIAGVLADRWSRRWMLCICLGLSAALAGLQSFADSQELFILMRSLSFGLSAGVTPIIVSLVANHASDNNRTWFISFLQCGYPFGWFLASIIVATLLGNGWRYIFLVGFLVAPIAIIFALCLPAKPPALTGSAPSKKDNSLRAMFSGPLKFTAFSFCAAFFFYGLASGAKVFYLPTFFQVSRGYSGETAALIVGSIQVVGIIGYVASAYVSRRFLSLRATAVLWAWAGALLFIVAIWLPHTQVQDFILFGLMAIFVNGTASIGIVFLIDRSPAHLRGSFMGLCGSASANAGFLVSPLVTTRLVEAIGWHWMYTIFVGSGLALSGLFFFMAGKASQKFSADAVTL